MGFFGDLFGGTKAKAIEKSAKLQADIARENRQLGEEYVSDSLADLDASLGEALGELDTAGTHLEPFSETGNLALSQLAALYGLGGPEAADAAMAGFTESPGYQFRLNEGISAIDRSAAARGGLYSGATGRELTRYGQGVASDEFGRYVGGLSSLANLGYGASGGLSGLVSDKASAILGTGANRGNVRSRGLSAITGANTDIGQIQAGGLISAANARQAGANNLLKLIETGARMVAGVPF